MEKLHETYQITCSGYSAAQSLRRALDLTGIACNAVRVVACQDGYWIEVDVIERNVDALRRFIDASPA